ncbi:MAG: MFS transporter [Pseudomonadota bacterium]
MAAIDGMTTTELEQPARALSGVQRAAVALGVSAMGVGMTINFVVVAPLTRDAGLTEIQVAGILTGSALFFAWMTPVWGRWGDRFGRKRVMITSLLCAAVTNAVFALTLGSALSGALVGMTAFFTLTAVRILFGLLSPGMFPASMGMMIEATTPMTRAAGMGLLGTSMSIGSIVGPAGAAVLAPFGAMAPLWGSIFFSAMCAGVLAVVLPPSRSRRDPGVRPKPLSLFDNRIRPHIGFLFAYFVIVGAIQITLAFLVADRYGLERADAVQAAGFAYAALAAAMVVIQFGYVQPRNPDPKQMLPRGLVLIVIGYLGGAFAMNFAVLCLSFFVVGIGAALVVPAANALGSLSVPQDEQAAAAAVLSSAPPWAFVVGPLLGAWLYGLHPNAPLIASSALMACLYIYAVRVTARR